MKLKYIFTLLGVMLLGLTSCGKKDAPKTESNNPFAGTQWEHIQSTAKEQGESEILTATIDFTDDSHFSFQTSYKVTAKDGSIKKSRETNKVNGTYTYNGLVATATTGNKNEQKTPKLILTMDETKQKLTAVSFLEGEKEQTAVFTRKK